MSGNNGGKKGKGKQQEKNKEVARQAKDGEKGEHDAQSIMKLKEELEAFKRLLSPITEETDEQLQVKINETKDFSQKITELNESVKATVKAMEDMCDKALTNDFTGYQMNPQSEAQAKPEPKVIEKGSKDEKAIMRLQEKIAKSQKSIDEIDQLATKLPTTSAIAKNRDCIIHLLQEDIHSQEHFIELMTMNK